MMILLQDISQISQITSHLFQKVKNNFDNQLLIVTAHLYRTHIYNHSIKLYSPMHLTVSSLNTNRLTLQFHSKCLAECNFIYEMCCWVIWFQLQCFRQFIKYHRILKWFGSILDNFSLDRARSISHFDAHTLSLLGFVLPYGFPIESF